MMYQMISSSRVIKSNIWPPETNQAKAYERGDEGPSSWSILKQGYVAFNNVNKPITATAFVYFRTHSVHFLVDGKENALRKPRLTECSFAEHLNERLKALVFIWMHQCFVLPSSSLSISATFLYSKKYQRFSPGTNAPFHVNLVTMVWWNFHIK